MKALTQHPESLVPTRSHRPFSRETAALVKNIRDAFTLIRANELVSGTVLSAGVMESHRLPLEDAVLVMSSRYGDLALHTPI
jgi:hypothetical protein